jgi:hypothetical protein
MSILPGLGFGAGYLYAAPSSTSGNPATNPTPMQIGAIQNVKLTFGADIKTLFGQQQWPIDSAVGKRSIKGSFESAQLSNQFISQLFTADPVTTGLNYTVLDEQDTVPATPYQVTVAQAAHFVQDYGVTYTATGVALVEHATPTTGQYSVNSATGVYTFAAADTTLGVTISYSYSSTTGGTTLTAANHQMGFGPLVALNVVFPYESITGGNAGMGFYLPNVRLGKIDITTKLEDYQMLSVDFEAFAGANGQPFIAYNQF